MSQFDTAYFQVLDGKSLSFEEASTAFDAIMAGEVSPVRLAAFLTALKIRGENPEELAGAASSMRRAAVRLPVQTPPEQMLDTCGTGGDKSGTFNVSTAVALVAASMGVRLAKHGNRAVSGRTGSADVLETMGVPIEGTPEQVARRIDEQGLGFIFAQAHHPAMKYAMPVRKELGVRTLFNLLGPLSNPAGARLQLLGLYNPALVEKVAEVLWRLGALSAMVVASLDGLDEISPADTTRIAYLKEGRIETFDFTPDMAGLESAPLADLKVESVAESAALIEAVLNGRGSLGARNVVLLNTAAALIVAGKTSDWKEGVSHVREALDNGTAKKYLERLKTARG